MPNSVHLWRINLDISEDSVHSLRQTLSETERARGDRFVTPLLRKRFVATRAAVRRILSGYVSSDPRFLEFDANAYGKPYLRAPGDSGIEFNLTHSKDLALLAVSRARRLGVDLELFRTLHEMDGICERFFSPADREFVGGATAEQKLSRFYQVWTRMEAFGKAHGTGIALPLMPRPSIDPRGPSQPGIQSDAGPESDSCWSLVQFEIGTTASVALVVEGAEWELRGFDFATA